MEEKKKFCVEFENEYNVKIEINEINIKLIFEEVLSPNEKIIEIFKQEYETKFKTSINRYKTTKHATKPFYVTVFFKEDNGDTMPAKIKEPRPNKMAKEEICCKEAPKTTKSSKNLNNKNNKK